MPRLQSSIALRTDSDAPSWLLINASPDIPRQLELYLHSNQGNAIRFSPLAGIFLTNADLDHTLGLLLLREGSRLSVFAADGVRDTLCQSLRFDTVLKSSCGIEWRELETGWQDSPLPEIEFQAIPLTGATAPRFARDSVGCHGVGYLFRDRKNKKVAGFFPDVAELNDQLLQILRDCEVVFFDGTFWHDRELPDLSLSERTAQQMGHIPIEKSREKFASLKAANTQLFYIHINNTNPILDPNSAQRQKIESAGLHMAEDGMRLIL